MIVEIKSVHPAVTMVVHDGQQHELPTAWFPSMPKVGQRWNVTLTAEPSPTEQYDQLNQLLHGDKQA